MGPRRRRLAPLLLASLSLGLLLALYAASSQPASWYDGLKPGVIIERRLAVSQQAVAPAASSPAQAPAVVSYGVQRVCLQLIPKRLSLTHVHGRASMPVHGGL